MEVLVVVVGVTWIVIGAALSLLMGQRGFDRFAWFVLGAVLGPLGLVLGVHSVVTETRRAPEVLAQASRRGGPVDVLVGFDGSARSRAAVRAAADLFGPSIGRLTLARAVPHGTGSETEREARASLRAEAEALAPRQVGLELVHGRPDAALTELAASARYDVLVVGTRGAGFSNEILGSVAVQLAKHSLLPVLLVGGDAAEATPRELISATAKR